MIRLNKYLANLGLCSRRKADELIQQGLIEVNGKVVTELGTQIKSEKVTLRKKILQLQPPLTYYLLHKPSGVTTSSKRTQTDPKIVLDFVPTQPRIFPVGRLDKLTTGLLVLTNDGVLAYQLTHPSFACEKEYEVTLKEPLTLGRERKVLAGMKLEGVKTQPVKLQRLSSKRVRVILTEGRNRQIRKIFGKVGCEVASLKRIRIQNLRLGNLLPGQYRALTAAEVRAFKKGQKSLP